MGVSVPPEVVAMTGVMAAPSQAVTLSKERVATGFGFTVMVPLAVADPQPCELVTVMVYSPLPLGVPEIVPVLALKLNPNMLEPVAEPPPIMAVMLLMAVPEHTAWLLLEERVTEGSGFTVTVAVAVPVQPFEAVPVTVYVPEVVGCTVAVLPNPPLHS